MPLTLLEIVQRARGRLGQPVPASVAGNTDPSVIQTLGILNEFLDDLALRLYWQSNIREATITALAQEDQGTLSTLFPFGYEGLIPDTFFNRTNHLRVEGGLTPTEWAARKATNFSGPIPAFRIRGNNLLMNPAPVAGHIYTVEYFSSYFIYNDTDAVFRKYFLKDADYCILDDNLPVAYIKWAWKKEKGLDYAEDFRKYEMMVQSKGLRDKRSPAISMNGCSNDFAPGIVVSPGSWPL